MIIRGVVQPKVWRMRTTGEPWKLIVKLQPWRMDDGPLVESVFVLERALESGESVDIDSGLRTIAPYGVVALRCEVTQRGNARQPARGRLLDVVSLAPDAALEAAADAQRPPVVAASRTLGDVSLVPLSKLSKQLVASRGEVDIKIDHETRSVAEDVLAMETAYAAVAPRLDEYALAVADRLLELYNDGDWRQDGWPEETRDSFASRIILEAISVESDGKVELCYWDDDLFAGHLIRAVVGPDGVEDADI